MKIDIAGQNDFKGWMDLLELVSDSFPGLVIDDYKIYLANSIERQCAAVCRDHEAVVGAAAFSCNDEEAVEIEFLAVHPECRRMGIAKELISFIIDRVPAGTRFTVVTYREDDAAGAAARKLYKGMGFKTGKLLMMFDYPCQEFEYKKSAGLTSPDFEKLYQENLSNVYKLAFGLAGNANDAEEIAQESFSRAFQHFSDFRGDSSFYTWIYRITLNVAQDYLKQRKKMPLQALTEDFGYSMEEILDENASNDPESQILSKETRYMCLHCMTECLPAEQRKIFCLAITLGLPHRMVAEIMECSLSKVKTTLHRARQRWFGYMENRCSYIKKSNPCDCAQWVRFGLKQGWVTEKPIEFTPRLDASLKTLAEIRNLKALREVYMSLYPQTMSAALCDRIKCGIKNKEWPTFL